MSLASRIGRAERAMRARAVADRSVPADRVAWADRARPEQLEPPGEWRTWLALGGRGSGKTRALAEAVHARASAGRSRRIGIVARTSEDLRTVAIAAVQAAAGPGLRYQPSNHHQLLWPNGAMAFGFSASEPESLRGHHLDLVWSDELAAYPDPSVYDQIQFALRAPGARLFISTTPRPTPLIRAIAADPRTIVSVLRTRDNPYIDAATIDYYRLYDGTRLGRQELEGEILDDPDGGIWELAWIEASRVATAPPLVRTVIAVDPAVGVGRGTDETGIIVVGKGGDGHGYVIADLSGRMSPDEWARLAAHAYRTWGADRIVAEVNNGGDLVRAAINAIDVGIPVQSIRATEAKRARAESVAALYQLGRVHHVGVHSLLEDQLCTATLERGGGPDDRLDALVWAIRDLDLAGSPLDVPGAIYHGGGVWPCVCGFLFPWWPGRRCPQCGVPADMTYDKPVDPDRGRAR